MSKTCNYCGDPATSTCNNCHKPVCDDCKVNVNIVASKPISEKSGLPPGKYQTCKGCSDELA